MRDVKEEKPDRRPGDKETLECIRRAIEGYRGNSGILMSAIGALMCGRHFGWHALRVMLSYSAYTKYERVLGVKFRDILPARTDRSQRINGIRMADAFGKFWQAIAGGFVPKREGAIVEAAPAQ